MKPESKKDVIGVALARLVRGALWLRWSLALAASLLIGVAYILGACLLWIIWDSMHASNWWHSRTDSMVDWLVQNCPANAIEHPTKGAK